MISSRVTSLVSVRLDLICKSMLERAMDKEEVRYETLLLMHKISRLMEHNTHSLITFMHCYVF